MAGGAITSSRDAVLVSALSGFIAGGINIALLTAGLLWKALNSTEDNNFSDTFFVMNLLMSALYLLGYLLVQTFLSTLGGIMQWIRNSKT